MIRRMNPVPNIASVGIPDASHQFGTLPVHISRQGIRTALRLPPSGAVDLLKGRSTTRSNPASASWRITEVRNRTAAAEQTLRALGT